MTSRVKKKALKSLKKMSLIHRKFLIGARYRWRSCNPYYGMLFTIDNKRPPNYENPALCFRVKHRGGFGWDIYRRQMHVYSCTRLRTDRVYRWQWEWNAYGYDRKTEAERISRFHICKKIKKINDL